MPEVHAFPANTHSKHRGSALDLLGDLAGGGAGEHICAPSMRVEVEGLMDRLCKCHGDLTGSVQDFRNFAEKAWPVGGQQPPKSDSSSALVGVLILEGGSPFRIRGRLCRLSDLLHAGLRRS